MADFFSSENKRRNGPASHLSGAEPIASSSRGSSRPAGRFSGSAARQERGRTDAGVQFIIPLQPVRSDLPLRGNARAWFHVLAGSNRDALVPDGQVSLDESQAIQPMLFEAGVLSEISHKIHRPLDPGGASEVLTRMQVRLRVATGPELCQPPADNRQVTCKTTD